jgi:hypothetical protein
MAPYCEEPISYISGLTKFLVGATSVFMTEQGSHLLEYVLGAKSKVAALRALFNSKVGMSGSAVAKRAGMGLLAIQNAVQSSIVIA